MARGDRPGLGRLPGRADGQRSAALRALHQRLDRQAQGHHAHHGRLHPVRQDDDQVGVRPPRRRYLLVHGRHRLDHRAQLRGLRPARGRRHRVHVRRGAQLRRIRTAGGTSSSGYRITILYTAPTAIRTFIKWGDQCPDDHDLRACGCWARVGEADQSRGLDVVPRSVGGGRCPIVDTWWQTETGGIMMSPLPGATPTKPGIARGRCRACCRKSWTRTARPVGRGRAAGWSSPALAGHAPRHLGDDERYRRQYWSDVPHLLLHRRQCPPRRATAITGSWAASTT